MAKPTIFFHYHYYNYTEFSFSFTIKRRIKDAICLANPNVAFPGGQAQKEYQRQR